VLELVLPKSHSLSTSPYTSNINLPSRYQISTSGSGSSGTMIQICSTVLSEGGYNPTGRSFSANTGATGATGTLFSPNEYPILFLRGGGGNYYHQNILPTSLSLISNNANDTLFYNVRLYIYPDNPISGGSGITWLSASTYSVAQYATAFGGGGSFQKGNSIIIDSGYFIGKTSNTYNISSKFNDITQINADCNNNSDILVVTLQDLGGTGASTFYGSIDWEEIY